MEIQELHKAVRAELGKIPTDNTVDIEPADILREADYILREIGTFLPEKVLRFITSVAQEPLYDVHDNTMRVQKVYRWDTIDEDLMKLGSISTDEADASEYYNFPSLWTIRQLRRLRNLPRVKHEWHPIGRKLKIKPTPDSTGLKYWYISIEKSEWTLANLPLDFEMLFVTGVAWKCLEIVALRRSDLGGVIREGGFVTYPSTELKKFVDSKRDSFYADLKVKAMLHR